MLLSAPPPCPALSIHCRRHILSERDCIMHPRPGPSPSSPSSPKHRLGISPLSPSPATAPQCRLCFLRWQLPLLRLPNRIHSQHRLCVLRRRHRRAVRRLRRMRHWVHLLQRLVCGQLGMQRQCRLLLQLWQQPVWCRPVRRYCSCPARHCHLRVMMMQVPLSG